MKQKGKRIAALICVILLVLLYVATLVVSLLDFEGSDQLFASCIVATIVPANSSVGLHLAVWKDNPEGYNCRSAPRPEERALSSDFSFGSSSLSALHDSGKAETGNFRFQFLLFFISYYFLILPVNAFLLYALCIILFSIHAFPAPEE